MGSDARVWVIEYESGGVWQPTFCMSSPIYTFGFKTKAGAMHEIRATERALGCEGEGRHRAAPYRRVEERG